MAAFIFQSITAAQALALGADDTLRFEGGPARLAIATYNPGGTVTVSFDGRAVEFAATLPAVSAAGGLTFADGTRLRVGAAGAENLQGTAGDDALFGGGGDDALTAHGGANLLQGNQGDDQIISDLGPDTIFGGQGDDVILAGVFVPGDAGNIVNGNLGNDSIAGGHGDDLLLGGQGDDLIHGGLGFDTLNGNLGDDHLVARGALSFLFGEGGADTLETRARDTFLVGGAGADVFKAEIDPGAGGFGGLVNVLDWSGDDSLSLTGVRGDHTYAEAVADAQAAQTVANALLRANARPGEVGNGVVSVEVGADVFVFVNSAGDTDADFTVRLIGRGLADIASDDII